MKSIDIEMTSVEVKSKTRAIKATWNRELVKDLEVFTRIDSSSFENYFVKEMRREMRKKSINKIFQN
jgi:hypothetical protein